jgi:DnaJ-class molecular chaperone
MGKDGDKGKHRRQQTCSLCNGAKGKWISKNGNKESAREWRPCHACKGTGQV